MARNDVIDILKELDNQIKLNAREIIANISHALKPGISQKELEDKVGEYLKTKIPEIKYFYDTVNSVEP
jgi:ribosomal protein S24E